MSEQNEIELRHEVHDLNKKVENLTEKVSGLVEAWNTATGVLKFVKVLGSMATAVVAIWAIFRMAFEVKK